MTQEQSRHTPNNHHEISKLMESALGRPFSPDEDPSSQEWKDAQAAMTSRLLAAEDVFSRIKQGEVIPKSEIDTAALAVVERIASQIESSSQA